MNRQEKFFLEAESELLLPFKGQRWTHYAIPLENSDPYYALVHMTLRCENSAVGLDVEEGDNSTGGFTHLLISDDCWGESRAEKLGGIYTFHKGDVIESIAIIRCHWEFRGDPTESYALSQDVGVAFQFDKGYLAFVKNPWYDFDIEIFHGGTIEEILSSPPPPPRDAVLGETSEVTLTLHPL
jgi:hypothetical protein